MKKKLTILTTVLIIITYSRAFCQNFPGAGDYLTNTTMGSFEGTWQWSGVIDTVRIQFKVMKRYVNINGGYYEDDLIGWHNYKRGPVVVENAIQYFNDINKRTFFGSNYQNINQIEGYLTDKRKNKSGELTLTLISNVTPNQLVWKLQNTPGLKVKTKESEPDFDWGFTLPRDMVLTKIN